jgi:predicted ATPase
LLVSPFVLLGKNSYVCPKPEKMIDQIKYIKRIEISKLWNKFDIEWNLNPDVNILAGGNGSGKSTILDCMFTLLTENMVYPKYTHFSNSITIYFNDDKCIKFTGGKAEKNYEDQLNVLFSMISTFEQEFVPLEVAKVLAYDNPYVHTNLDLHISALQVKYLNYKLDIGKRKDIITDKFDNPKEEITKLRYSQNRFLEILDELFTETGKKVNRETNEISFLSDDNLIWAYQLSSGEKQILIILLRVLIQDNKQTILFMDEPEISLHIDWQQKLIGYVRELNPNVQLIIATHSPAIIMDGWLDKVFEINDIIKSKTNSK